jgi:hypothetical protein
MWHSQARKLEVALVDTTGAEDIHINDVLVYEGLAEYETSRLTVPPQQPPTPQLHRVTLLEQLRKFNFK